MKNEARSPESTLRRIVTAHDKNGRSVIAIDGPPSEQIEWDVGGGLYEIWTELASMRNTHQVREPAPSKIELTPPKGAFKVRWFSVAPTPAGMSSEEMARTTADAFAVIGAADQQPDTARHPAMHTTRTIDVIILVSGRVRLLLDEGERVLSPGDVVIQRGTNHAWVAEGDETAVLVAVLVDRDRGQGVLGPAEG